jgi:protein TonB
MMPTQEASAGFGRLDDSIVASSGRGEPVVRRRWITASLLLHSGIIAALIAWPLPIVPVEVPLPPPPITVVFDRPGSAGAAGGTGGDASGTPASGTPAPPVEPVAPPAPPVAATAPAVEPPTPPVVATTPPKPDTDTTVAAPAGFRSQQKVAVLPPPQPQHKPPPPRHVVKRAAAPAPPRPASPAAAMPSPPAPAPPADVPPTTAVASAAGGPGAPAASGLGSSGVGHGSIGNGSANGPGDDYLRALQRWLERYKRYPPEAIDKNIEGKVVIGFTLARNGTVLDAWIERSSGAPIIDQAALAMLHRASPVPPLPQDYKGDELKLAMPVDYALGFFDRMFH